jgi:hypothetical protein
MPEFTAATSRKYWLHMHPGMYDSLGKKYIKAGPSKARTGPREKSRVVADVA